MVHPRQVGRRENYVTPINLHPRDILGTPLTPQQMRQANYEANQGLKRLAVGARRVLFPKQKQMPKSIDTQKMMVTGTGGILRTTERVKGKSAKIKKAKTVHVSRHLRDAIKQVNEGQTAHGHYSRIAGGCIGTIFGNDTVAGTVAALSVTDPGWINGQLVVSGPAINAPAGSWSLFNALCTYTPGATSSLLSGTDMNFFTPGRILHAASVLFNGKQEALAAYMSSGGNLSTLFNPSSGVVTTATPGSLKIHIKHSWVKFVMKNLSNRVALVDVWQLGTKTKFQNKNPVDSLYNTAVTVVDTATVDAELKYNTTSGLVRSYAYLEGNLDPVQFFGKIGYQFKGLHREYVMQPDETCEFFVSGPSGVIDYAKLLQDGTYQNALHKNFSDSVMFGVRVDQALAKTGNNSGARIATAKAATDNVLSTPIAVEFQENYFLAVPEIAGFVDANPAAGTFQPLNFRKNKRVITNYVGTNSNILPTIANEENPLLPADGT